MKKTLIISNLVWILIVSSILFKSCKPAPENAEKVNAKKESDVVLNYDGKEFKELELGAASNLSMRYVKNYLPMIKKNMGIDDARAIWFSLDELKHFIWLIEYHTPKIDSSVKSSDLGVQIYYGQYPSLDEIKSVVDYKDINPEFANMHTLFMVPTVKINGKNTKFNPRQNINKKYDKIFPLFENPNVKNGNFRFTSPESSTILNHGGLQPPYNTD